MFLGHPKILLKTIDNVKVCVMLKSMKSIESNLFIDEHGQGKSIRKDDCAFDGASLTLAVLAAKEGGKNESIPSMVQG